MDDENKEITIAGGFNCDLLKKDCVNPSIKDDEILNRHLSPSTVD